MIPISEKKCPICHATFPSKVVFCSICGTELDEDIKELKPTPEFPVDDFTKDLPERRFFKDEPLETRNRNSEYVVDDTQFAWQFSDTVVPIRMKGDISYSDNFKSPKLKIKQIKDLSIYQMIILGGLGLVISLSMVTFVGVSLLLALNTVPISGSSVSLMIMSFLVSSAAYFLINSTTTKIIAGWKDKTIKITKASIVSYSLTQIAHLAVISAISIAIIKILFRSAETTNIGYTFYVPVIIISIVISIVSPPFRIAKLLSSAGNANIFQNFQDAIQFPNISIRRTLEISLVTYILPATLLIAVLSPIVRLLMSFLSPETGLYASTWDFVGLGIILVVLVACVVGTTFVDVNTFYYYEELIQKYVEPPSLKWMDNLNDEQHSDNHDRKPSSTKTRENRCPVCSSILIEGAEFCTDCGKKVIK